MLVKRLTKKRARSADDVVLGLEQGDEARCPRPVNLAEADEGVHLVNVAPHRFAPALEPADERVGCVVERAAIALSAAAAAR